MKARAFTLVEVLIVVLILGIIATIILPRFSNASATARASMLADNLRILRTQVQVFKGQHRGVPPGYPNCQPSQTPTEEAFVAQMTQSSTADGATAPPNTPGYRYGPYVRQIPENPVNGKASVQIVPDSAEFPTAADDSHGWIYQPSTGMLKADCTGSDENGISYFDY